MFLNGVAGFTNVALAAQKHQHIAAAVFAEFFYRVDNPLLQGFAFFSLDLLQRPVTHFHRPGAAGHIDDGGIIEVSGKTLGVNRRRSNNQFQVFSFLQQTLQIAQQKIDIETALVRFVNNDGVVLIEIRVVLALGQQDAIGHQLDITVVIRLVGKPHLVTDGFAKFDTEFFGNTLADRARGKTARLGVADLATHTQSQLQADFGQLRGFAGTGFTTQHGDLIFPNRLFDAFRFLRNRQFRRVVHCRDVLPPLRCHRYGRIHVALQLLQHGLLPVAVTQFADFLQATVKPAHVYQHALFQLFLQAGKCQGWTGNEYDGCGIIPAESGRRGCAPRQMALFLR